MPRKHVKLPASAFERYPTLSFCMQPGEEVELSNGIPYQTAGSIRSQPSGNLIGITFLEVGTLRILSSETPRDPSGASESGPAHVSTRTLPSLKVTAKARVDEGGDVKGGMYVSRAGSGPGSFDMLYFKGRTWAVKLGCLRHIQDKYTWVFSVRVQPKTRYMPFSGRPDSAGEGQDSILSTWPQPFYKLKGPAEAEDILRGMIREFDVHKKLRNAGCEEEDQGTVIENLVDRLLVMIEEFKGRDT